METSAISYRVADFLKRHAPFNSVDDVDLLALAGGGRVRFHEPNEYILWQGEPHRYQVFVLQQGTVSLWDESAEGARLRDIRGAGDMLGIERYNDLRKTEPMPVTTHVPVLAVRIIASSTYSPRISPTAMMVLSAISPWVTSIIGPIASAIDE